MSRAKTTSPPSRADRLRAELELAELEEELSAAKGAGPVDRDLKNRVREARQAFRENHRDVVAEEG